ncbi:TPA: hypothetical protein ACHKB2_002549 [Acinetobacter baumannii]|uniref:hypothetical protein n=1 Tax=Acinetobacter calcoaceticus/baumannii complex TaxID=909768 RepID=UPI0004511582|nr:MULTISPECIES: hypothetical protein [Acinetobacter calcoaceticus/baumannii complex]AJB48196.1 hypothetical protein RR32_08750 [Acinetobacter nosocomialis]EXE73194.1 hypothetical protein J582_3383 [Acinetobacter sp. 1566109]MBJ9962641.1 hypothetical protein [Acinetobacter nosocomialis]MBR7741533.1 hypothetical protein [Acinetobacter nosocomialis]MBR7751945.1 hypothetical protein [Acinetobacter nosocomialis]
MKKYLLTCLLPIFATACSAKPTPQEELDIQATFLPTVFNLDASTYALAPKEAPTALTKQLYDDALFKLGLLKRYDDQASVNFKLEKTVESIKLNTLCLMSKFVNNPTYIKAVKHSIEQEPDLNKWLKENQPKWQKALSKENPAIFDYPCNITIKPL